jgi:hypothetical protein
MSWLHPMMSAPEATAIAAVIIIDSSKGKSPATIRRRPD